MTSKASSPKVSNKPSDQGRIWKSFDNLMSKKANPLPILVLVPLVKYLFNKMPVNSLSLLHGNLARSVGMLEVRSEVKVHAGEQSHIQGCQLHTSG